VCHWLTASLSNGSARAIALAANANANGRAQGAGCGHRDVVQLECLRRGIWGTKSLWGRVVTYPAT
jgi:hypothetical protein